MASNPLSIQSSNAKLIRNVRLYALGLVLLGFTTALYICFTFYRMDRLDRAVVEYVRTDLDLSQSTLAQSSLERNKTLLMGFLLDGQGNPEDLQKMLRGMKVEGNLGSSGSSLSAGYQEVVGRDDQWYSQVAHPLIEERKAVDAHRATFEELISQYHNMTPSMNQMVWKAEMDSALKTQKRLTSMNRVVGYVPPHINIEYFIVLSLVAGLSLMVVGLLINLKKLQDGVSQGA